MDYDDKFEMTPEMEKTMEELKRKIQIDYGNEETEDGQIFRFLRARDFNLTQAENMLRKHIAWKQDYRIPQIAEEYVLNEIQIKYYTMCLLTYSITGHPVIFFDFGNCDYKGLLKSIKYKDLIDGLLKTMVEFENILHDQTIKLGKRLEKWIFIFDCHDIHISQFLYKPTVDFIMEVFHMYEANYPERLKVAYCINASPIFYTIFNILKPFLSSTTLEKARIFGREGWKEEILKIIPDKDLPAFLGGTRTDPDGNPLCLNTVSFCAPIPKHYYFRSPGNRLKNKPNTKEYILKRSVTFEIPFCINEDHLRIEWEFETEKGDIAFGLLYKMKADSQELTSLIDIHRVNADMQIEEGSYSCDKCGTYILLLDNSHSWLREKQVYLRACTVNSGGEKNFIS